MNSELHTNPAGHLVSRTEETRQIQRVALYAFLLNFGLAGLKAALAYLSGSLAVVASAVDSATDSVASLAVLCGLKLSTRKSHTFPYGLYKIENVISVIVAIFIFLG
jgi:divalent metal cation (Fe/Co/Zn/Cd) transporter